MLEKCVLNSYLILLFSRKIPTFSYFLMKIPTFSYFFDLSYYLTPCTMCTFSFPFLVGTLIYNQNPYLRV